MPNKMIKDGALIDDQWQLLELDENSQAADITVPTGNVIVPLSVWQSQRPTLQARGDVGVWLNSDEAAAELAQDSTQLPLIAVNFPGFMDGRGFSIGRELRERHGFNGELRAIGHFIRDQFSYLSRCGFNAFAYAEDVKESSIASLQDFSESYQAAMDQPLPLFRRRA